MSIQKITQTEIFENGIKSLPTRPSTPSLYKGSTLSAEELRDAFDKLPTLIAERFNALLESTGLYDAEHPADSLAALIATNLSSSHSLLNFFEDIKNGNLSLYLAAGESGEPLADVLSELRSAIASTKSFTITEEGDGELLTDISYENEGLKVKRGARIGDILNEAKAYTDAPTGNVASGCKSPVSGDAVFHAIKSTAEKQSNRITALEYIAKDVFYNYPIVDDRFSYKRISEDALTNAALLKMGSLPMEQHNIFPEQLLYDFTSGDLTITWDNEEKALVINGTLHATESPLRIAPFDRAIPDNGYFGFAVFYRDGSISTKKAKLSLVSDTNATVDLPLLMDDSTAPSTCFHNGTRFSGLELTTTVDTVFDNYRCNFVIAKEKAVLHYEPFRSRNSFGFPKKLSAVGSNLWQGPSELCGETCVSFTLPPHIFDSGNYILGFFAQSTSPSTNILVTLHLEDGTVIKRSWSQRHFRSTALVTESPLVEVRAYASNTEANSAGHSIKLTQFYFDPAEAGYDKTASYMQGHYDEIVFPDSFRRFSDRFLGYDIGCCNYFDFEKGCFFDDYASLCIDGTLAFEEVDKTIGRFSAPFSVPEDLRNGALTYGSSAIFFTPTDSPGDEMLWFTDDHVVFQSSIFVGKDPESVQRFFTLCPIDVVYKKLTSQKTLFTEEEKAFFEAPTFRISPACYLCFHENGEPVHTYSQIQYQTKITEDVI